MSPFSSNAQASSVRLLDRFYGLFLALCIVLLTVGVPFVFYRKAASAGVTLVMMVAVLTCWRMSRRGKPEGALILFACGLLAVLVGLMFGGLTPITAAIAMAMAVMLAVVIDLRAGVIFSAVYLLAWLLYIVLLANQMAPEPYFTGAPLTGWLIGAVSVWLVLLPTPELVLNMRRTASLQRAVIEAATDGILVVNNEGNVETYNQRFLDFWHIPQSDLETHNDSGVLDLVAQQLDDPDQFLKKVRELYAHPDQSGVDTLRFKDGRVVERHSQPQRLDDQIVGRVWSFRDVTERERAQDEIHRLAFHDALTMLPNRRLLDDRLSQIMVRARREQSRFALLFIDLDRFKPINDEYGHEVGDQLLQSAAQRIQSCIRASDTAARIGGDEFVVLLPNIQTPGDAVTVAEKIRLAIGQPLMPLSELPVSASCSIGIATYPDHGNTEQDLLRLGDAAMYRAKKAGGNRVEICALDAQPVDLEEGVAAGLSVVRLIWKPAFSCGNPVIDQEHQEMFRLANILLGRAVTRTDEPGRFYAAFDALLAHIVEHFGHEEAILAGHGYEQITEHVQMHQALVAQTFKLRSQADEGGVSIGDLVDFLVTKVVLHHLLSEDRRFFDLFSDHKTAAR